MVMLISPCWYTCEQSIDGSPTVFTSISGSLFAAIFLFTTYVDMAQYPNLSHGVSRQQRCGSIRWNFVVIRSKFTLFTFPAYCRHLAVFIIIIRYRLLTIVRLFIRVGKNHKRFLDCWFECSHQHLVRRRDLIKTLHRSVKPAFKFVHD